jgi:transcriptional regulator with XRE-family HTH domain
MAALFFSENSKVLTMSVSQNLGRRIQRLRVTKGLTQEQLCELAEIDRSYIQRIEAGTRTPSIEIVIRIQKGLGCSWDELLKGL